MLIPDLIFILNFYDSLEFDLVLYCSANSLGALLRKIEFLI